MSFHSNGSVSFALRFFGLAFAISWILGLLVAAILQAILPESLDRASLLLAKFGPTIAGLIMAVAISGREGLGFLLRASVRVRAPLLGYAVALLAPPLLFGAALALFHATGGDVDWSFIDEVTLPAVVIAMATFTFLGGGFGEELGWRGFALPMLQRRMTALQASMVVGFVWAAWHYPAMFLDAERNDSPIWLFTLFVVAATVFMTWLYNSTRGNVFLAVLFHASFNASESLMEDAVSPAAETQLEMWLVGLYALLAVFILVAFGASNLSWRLRSVWPDATATARARSADAISAPPNRQNSPAGDAN